MAMNVHTALALQVWRLHLAELELKALTQDKWILRKALEKKTTQQEGKADPRGTAWG